MSPKSLYLCHNLIKICPLVIIAFSILFVHKSIAIDEGGFSFLKIMAEGSDIFERYYIVKIKKNLLYNYQNNRIIVAMFYIINLPGIIREYDVFEKHQICSNLSNKKTLSWEFRK